MIKPLLLQLLALFCLLLSAITQAEAISAISDSRHQWLIKQGILQAEKEPEYINSLIHEDSPYLLSHAFQPVNWQAWHKVSLTKAKNENRLIYLSIGYETCHWCHVLAKESYDDKDVASVLNKHFVSIKVDRERRPDLDQKYRRALENMTGSPGWPIQVILTPEKQILWIDSYTSKEKLQKILGTLAKKWQKSPLALNKFASIQQQQLLPAMKSSASKMSTAQYQAKSADLLGEMRQVLAFEQEGNGPRFLRANWLLALLDEYVKSKNEGDLTLVIKQVEQLLTSPTYDFIDGGMHRYAEDGNWQRPHYEKMLYDQAQLIKVLVRLNLLTNKVTYINFAKQVIRFVESKLKLSNGLYASSLSALSSGIEGKYYYFENNEFTHTPYWQISSVNNFKALSLKSVELPPNNLLTSLSNKRKEHVLPSRDDKAILAWNTMYLLSLTEFYQVTKQDDILISVKSLTDKLTTYWADEQLFRIVFQNKFSIKAQPADYAWLNLALNEVRWTLGKFPYKDELLAAQIGLLSNLKGGEWSNLQQDSELPSTAAVVLKALNQMATYADGVATRSIYSVRAEMKASFNAPSLQLNSANLFFNWHKRDERLMQLIKPFARGHGVVRVKSSSASGMLLEVELENGWHINSNTPLQKNLIKTEVIVEGTLGKVIYPVPELKSLSFNEQLLSLYEGTTQLTLNFSGNNSIAKRVMLRVQACSDKVCLPPENINIGNYKK